MSARGKGPRDAVGIALDGDRLTAVLPDADDDARVAWTRTLAPQEAGAPWSDLASKLAELKSLVGARRTLFVALMPGLAQLRLIELPGVTEEEAARVVRRDPSRFFPTRGAPLLVELDATGWRRRSPFVAAAASRQLVEAIGSAVAESGWSLGGIAPAAVAWMARPSGARGARQLLVHLDRHVELLGVRRHMLTTYRRLPPILSSSSPAARDELAMHGVEVSAAADVIADESEAASTAARYVVRVAAPLLLPDEVRLVARKSERRAAGIRIAAAVALLLVSAAAELVGMQRGRARIAVERSRMRQSVVQSMAIRESIAVLREWLGTLGSADASEPRWSDLVAELAGMLPSDAFLVALRGNGDSLHLEGIATRAAPVFDAVRLVRGVRDVQAVAPIRQEVRDDRTASERFVLAARLAGARAPAGTGAPNDNRRAASGGGR